MLHVLFVLLCLLGLIFYPNILITVRISGSCREDVRLFRNSCFRV